MALTHIVAAVGQFPHDDAVLVVKRLAERRDTRALLATNGTDNAPEALAFVEALLPGANLHLVQTVQIAP